MTTTSQLGHEASTGKPEVESGGGAYLPDDPVGDRGEPSAPGPQQPPAIAPAPDVKSRWPTNKWWAALVTVAGSWVASLLTAGAFTKEIAIALVGIVSQMTVAYLVPNSDTPGGIQRRGKK